VFDGDDTLWATQPIYERAKRRLRLLLIRHELDADRALKKLDHIDSANVRLFGWSPRRFPGSMRHVVVTLFGSSSRVAKVAARAEAIGRRVFNEPAKVYAGAYRLLALLRRRNISAALLTRGDRKVQLQRINESGLTNLFNTIRIVREKSVGNYRSLARAAAALPGDCWAVGNSFKSDVVPALKAGMISIFIPRRTWVNEFTNQSAAPITLANLTQLRRLLERTSRLGK
jgi:putative hydrolase of the HAD superfamily